MSEETYAYLDFLLFFVINGLVRWLWLMRIDLNVTTKANWDLIANGNLHNAFEEGYHQDHR